MPSPIPAPRRILMTTDTIGGIWNFVIELCAGMRETEVLLATMGGPLSRSQRRQATALSHVELAESSFKLEWMDQPWADVERAGEWLLALEDRFDPEVVHLNGYSQAALPFTAPVLVTAHSCVLSWWMAVKGKPAPMNEWEIYAHRVKAGLRAADLIVAPTTAMMEAIRYHHDPSLRGKIIYNGTRFPKAWTIEDEKEPLFLSVGRLWDDAKNAQALTAIAADLPWPVVMAGDASAPDGSSVTLPNVRLTGKISSVKLNKLYRRSSVYVHPARYEPFGLSVLEAALSGCVLVLGDIPTLREIWGDAAIYVDPSDSGELREILLRLASDKDFQKKLVRQSFFRARQYPADRMTREYLAAYSELLYTAGSQPLISSL